LRDELTTAKVRLNAKLAESNILKSKINLERNRFEKTARGLTLLNKKLTSLITRHNFISDQQSLNDVADEVRLENLSTDLQRLLLKLKNGNQEKDSFIKKLEQLSKNTVYKQPFSRSIKPETTSITQGPLSKGYQNKKSNGKKVGFLSPRSFLKNKHNVGLPVKGKIVKLFGQTDPIGLTTKGITISTRPGAHVVASFDGRVIYAGPFRTYGNILIIDHGEGFSTLLVGLGYIGVKTEQVILGGEPVGKMETGPLKNKEINQKLYIELRKHGKPIDPMAWLS
jgi:septal ring factor EnvC (AmiA/AmiB activator)